MKNKTLGFLIIIVLILGTLILSNYFIDYYKLSGPNKDIISENTTLVMRNNSVLKGQEIQKVYDQTKALNMSQDLIEYYINTNDSLDFFKDTKEIIINQPLEVDFDSVLSFGISDEGIKNLEDMPDLEKITFDYIVDDYSIKQEYSYSYTNEDEEEFVNKLEEQIKSENKKVIDDLSSAKIDVEINIEVV